MRNILDLIEYEARRRPDTIGVLYNRAKSGEITREEIEQANLPLPWFRKALSMVLDTHEQVVATNKGWKVLADMEAAGLVEYGYTADIAGTIMTYNGVEEFFIVGKSHLLVEYGRPIFFPDNGGVWIDTVYSDFIDPKLRMACIAPEKATRTEYKSKWRNAIPDNRDPTITDCDGLPRLGVRFG